MIGESRFTFTETCEYPDGGQVASMVCDLRDARIAREVQLQAWDEQLGLGGSSEAGPAL